MISTVITRPDGTPIVWHTVDFAEMASARFHNAYIAAFKSPSINRFAGLDDESFEWPDDDLETLEGEE